MPVPLDKLWAPRWREEEVAGDRWGTYFIDEKPVAGYEQLAGQLVTAQMFYLDEMDCPRKLFDIEGRDGQFATIPDAKEAILMIAKPQPKPNSN